LAQDEEPGMRSREAGGRGGLGTMTERELPERLRGMPDPKSNPVEKIATTIGFGLLSAFIPGTGVASGLLHDYLLRQKERLQKILVEEVSKGNLRDLSDPRLESLIPMAHRLAEACKQGDYEHNLRILSAFIRGEFEQDIPDPSNFGRMARRVEGLSTTDLKVLALVHAFENDLKRQPNREVSRRNPPFVCGSSLTNSPLNHSELSRAAIQESLVDLAARGFLRADGASRMDKDEEYYYPTSSLRELINRAGEHIK
jgi:hypothetical protein